MHDDRELLRKYADDRCDDAFRALVERHAGMVHGAALRIVQDGPLAEEVTQGVFILLARKASSLSANTIIAGWLYQTTRYVARGALRAERRRQQRHRDFAAMNDHADAASVWDQIKPHLDDALSKLGAPDRDALVLRFLEGRPFAEVATSLGITEAAAKMRVSRALDKLGRTLGRCGVVVSLAALTTALTSHATAAAPAALIAHTAATAATTSLNLSPNLALIIKETLQLMALQKLKATLAAGVVALLLLGGGLALLLPRVKPVPNATPPIAQVDGNLIVTTFEPMTGDWEGTWESHAEGQAPARPQRVKLTIRTSEQGRTCHIEMNPLDRNDRPVSTFNFVHALNAAGNRILTTDDPGIGGTLDGSVTEATQNSSTGEWRAAFRATRPGSENITECRWVRQGDELTISRRDDTATAQGLSSRFSELTLRPKSNKPRTAFNALPRGNQTFDGVSFFIPRPVNIIGARAARAKGREFARVTDPTVHARGRHIHVLHTGDHGSSSTGDFIWRLVVLYADGSRERFDFAYDIHLRNFWRRAGDGPATPSDPDTTLAWVGSSQESDQRGADLVISRTTLLNPKPTVEVVGAEFVSLFGPSSAYVLAVTITDDGPKPARAERAFAPHQSSCTLIVQNSGGQPLSGATVECELEGDGFVARLAPFATASDGRISFDIATEVIRAIHYQIQRPDGRNEPGTVEVLPTDKAWPPQVIRLPD